MLMYEHETAAYKKQRKPFLVFYHDTTDRFFITSCALGVFLIKDIRFKEGNLARH